MTEGFNSSNERHSTYGQESFLGRTIAADYLRRSKNAIRSAMPVKSALNFDEDGLVEPTDDSDSPGEARSLGASSVQYSFSSTVRSYGKTVGSPTIRNNKRLSMSYQDKRCNNDHMGNGSPTRSVSRDGTRARKSPDTIPDTREQVIDGMRKKNPINSSVIPPSPMHLSPNQSPKNSVKPHSPSSTAIAPVRLSAAALIARSTAVNTPSSVNRNHDTDKMRNSSIVNASQQSSEALSRPHQHSVTPSQNSNINADILTERFYNALEDIASRRIEAFARKLKSDTVRPIPNS